MQLKFKSVSVVLLCIVHFYTHRKWSALIQSKRTGNHIPLIFGSIWKEKKKRSVFFFLSPVIQQHCCSLSRPVPAAAWHLSKCPRQHCCFKDLHLTKKKSRGSGFHFNIDRLRRKRLMMRRHQPPHPPTRPPQKKSQNVPHLSFSLTQFACSWDFHCRFASFFLKQYTKQCC